jgi:hypothetical protein
MRYVENTTNKYVDGTNGCISVWTLNGFYIMVTLDVYFEYTFVGVSSMYLTLGIVVMLMLGIIYVVFFSFTNLVLICGLSTFNFYHTYFFRSNIILINYPKLKV